jgi:hypothetical protein
MTRRYVGVGGLLFGLLCWGAVGAREISFEERVRAEEAILGVYARHQEGRPAGAPLPAGLAEERVRRYLRETVALERFWATSVTAEMLEREAERIARDTAMPDRLGELYRALGNDPVLVKECLVRPVLVSRLLHSFFGGDQRIREGQEGDPPGAETDASARSEVRGAFRERSRNRARAGRVARREEEQDGGARLGEQPRPPSRPLMPHRGFGEWWRQVEGDLDERSVRTVAQPTPLPAPGARKLGGVASPRSGEKAVGACQDRWDNGVLDDVPPDGIFTESAVWTGTHMIFPDWVWGAPRANRNVAYDPLLDRWEFRSTAGMPSGRQGATAIWTGREVIVWGGDPFGQETDRGARYDPATDTWRPVSTVGASPCLRAWHRAVWTGSEMIVWGGVARDSGCPLGERYDPATDSWRPVATPSFFVPFGGQAVWTGKYMVVWGGFGPDGSESDDGGRYDPVADQWYPMSKVRAPSAREGHTMVWTGKEVVVWGGRKTVYLPDGTVYFEAFGDGSRYDPERDKWTFISKQNAPEPRSAHSAVWTGTHMIVWGGVYADRRDQRGLNTGGMYDPQADTWVATTTVNAPGARSAHLAVYGAGLMIIWGRGYQSGGRYDPRTDSWTPTSTASNPEDRESHTLVWTGTHMIVWGGYLSSFRITTRSGSRYDPVLDAWFPMTEEGAPSPRSDHTAVWTGRRMIVWGGDAKNAGVPLGDGGQYDPLEDRWYPVSNQGAPPPRFLHVAVWTGSRMIVWGGSSTGPDSHRAGGVYDPETDTWRPTTQEGAPSERQDATAVWTGREMIVWGSHQDEWGFYDNTGGRYNPETDTWLPTSVVNAPEGRANHSAVWTGSRMIIWGGDDGFDRAFRDGWLYDPETDSWSLIELVGSPTWRSHHAGLWTGRRMIIWGGVFDSWLDTGGIYDPETNRWTAETTTEGAPTPRSGRPSVWTGRMMIVRGGLVDGGRYFPPPEVPPSGVPSLVVEGSGGATTLTWWPLEEASAYDVVRGGLNALRDSGGDFGASVNSCIADDTEVTSAEDAEVPASGDGFWYLVRGVNCVGPGSYDTGEPSQSGSRDPGIGSSALACP